MRRRTVVYVLILSIQIGNLVDVELPLAIGPELGQALELHARQRGAAGLAEILGFGALQQARHRLAVHFGGPTDRIRLGVRGATSHHGKVRGAVRGLFTQSRQA